ncbi:MAG: DNA polymerase III [Candidatus Parcubacteria bacterium]|nr:MAG: DNA polymerase III [Candidatus Parcubacteria bacterium]
MDEEKIYFLALSYNFELANNQNIGKLYKKLKSFKKIFYANEDKLKVKKDWEKEYGNLKKLNGDILLPTDNKFPKILNNLKEVCLGLFIFKNNQTDILDNLNDDRIIKIAIVGTRKSSSLGKQTAFNFSKQLSELGVINISGLAYGIDEYSHKGALSIGAKNIAVIGCGLDIILKDTRKTLVEKIISNNGLIISEYPLKAKGLKHHFPLRNRIIAALSNGILIIEAPLQSGALITARYGLEYGKEIFAIPDSIYNKNYEGCLRLIQKGAKLVIDINDILKEFDFIMPLKIKNLKLSEKEKIIIEAIKQGKNTFNDLNQNINLSIDEILSLLTHLEIKGVIHNSGGRFYIQADY